MNKWINPSTLMWAAGILIAIATTYTKSQVELSKLRSDMGSLAVEIQADTDKRINKINNTQNDQMSQLQTNVNGQMSTLRANVNGRLSVLSQDVAVLDQHVEDLENDLLRRLEKIEAILDQLLRRQLSNTR